MSAIKETVTNPNTVTDPNAEYKNFVNVLLSYIDKANRIEAKIFITGKKRNAAREIVRNDIRNEQMAISRESQNFGKYDESTIEEFIRNHKEKIEDIRIKLNKIDAMI